MSIFCQFCQTENSSDFEWFDTDVLTRTSVIALGRSFSSYHICPSATHFVDLFPGRGEDLSSLCGTEAVRTQILH